MVGVGAAVAVRVAAGAAVGVALGGGRGVALGVCEGAGVEDGSGPVTKVQARRLMLIPIRATNLTWVFIGSLLKQGIQLFLTTSGKKMK